MKNSLSTCSSSDVHASRTRHQQAQNSSCLKRMWGGGGRQESTNSNYLKVLDFFPQSLLTWSKTKLFQILFNYQPNAFM